MQLEGLEPQPHHEFGEGEQDGRGDDHLLEDVGVAERLGRLAWRRKPHAGTRGGLPAAARRHADTPGAAMAILRAASIILLSALSALGAARAADSLPQGVRGPGVPPFYVRAGFTVTVAAADLGETRSLAFDDHGTLYLCQPGSGSILALRDDQRSGTYRTVGAFVGGKPTVHGLCFRAGWLWFAQSGAIHKARTRPDGGAAEEVVTVVPEGQLPSGGGHWFRSILVDDDGFYTSIGDSQNDSDETATERQKIWRYSLDGKQKTLFCSGIRNTEKLRYRPGTTEVWGCDHGSDNFGAKLGEQRGHQPLTDANPPCEFNRYEQDRFYGHPFVVGNQVPRLEWLDRPDLLDLVRKATPPAWCFGAHWAACGFAFSTGAGLSPDRMSVFCAMHGSWNSTRKVGYRIEQVLIDDQTGLPYGSRRIVGTLAEDGETVLDRPVDCAEAPDGSVLFSCDQGQRIYRIAAAAK
jgi:glucose/arabinose dehydrogenase